MDVDVSVDIDTSEYIDATEVAIEGERALATSTLAPTSTSDLVGVSYVTPHPTFTSIAITTGFIIVHQKFLQSIVKQKDATMLCLRWYLYIHRFSLGFR